MHAIVLAECAVIDSWIFMSVSMEDPMKRSKRWKFINLHLLYLYVSTHNSTHYNCITD